MGKYRRIGCIVGEYSPDECSMRQGTVMVGTESGVPTILTISVHEIMELSKERVSPSQTRLGVWRKRFA